MASVVFSGEYGDNSGREWYMEIYSLTTLSNANPSLDLMAPGVDLTYEMDSSDLAKAMVGSAASMTIRMTDEQLGKLRTLLNYQEGTVGLILYNSATPAVANIEWIGHLLVEQTSIYMRSEINTTTLTFSDGLSHLKYLDYKADDGSLWWDRQSMIRHLFRCLRNVPSINFLRSRFPNTSYAFVKEIGLPAPANPGASYFEWPWASQPILSNTYLHSQTFSKPKEQTERHRNLFQDPEFVSCYDVVEDVCKTFGCAISFTGGQWVIWSRTSAFNFSSEKTLSAFAHSFIISSGDFFIQDGRPALSSTTDTADVYIGESNKRYTLDGATEGRSMPLNSVIVTHEDAEKDTIFAEGLSRRRFRWMDPTPGEFSQHSLFNGYPGSTVGIQAANDQYSYGSNRNYGYPYVFDFTLYDYVDTLFNPSYRTRLHIDNPLFRFGFPDRVNNDLAMVGGQEMMFALAGSMRLREHIDNLETSFITDTHAIDSVFILKARIEVTDTDGTSYRLSRTVEFLDTPLADLHLKLDALEPAIDVVHYHRIYNEMNWLDDGHADYGDAWFEIIIPHGATANNDGDFENIIAQVPGQYQGQNSYGGIFCEWNDDNKRLEASKSTIKDQFRDLRFKEKIKLQLPEDQDVVFSTAKLSWRISHNGNNGNLLWESGTSNSTSDATFPYPFGRSWFSYPERIALNYAEIRLGDGSNDMDLLTSASGGDGLETYNIGGSRIGSRDGLLNPQVTGHVIAPYATDSSGTLDDNGLDPSLNGYGFVNLKWTPHKDSSTGGPAAGRYNSLHQLVTSEHLACFGKQLRTFQGSIIEKNTSTDILRPYNVFTTSDYDESLSFDVMITRLNWSMLQGYRFEGIGISANRLDLADVVLEEKKPRGPGSGRNPGKPGVTEQVYGLNSGQVGGDIGGLTDDVTTLSSEVNTAKDDLEAQSFFLER